MLPHQVGDTEMLPHQVGDSTLPHQVGDSTLPHKVGVPLMEFVYFVFTCVPRERVTANDSGP